MRSPIAAAPVLLLAACVAPASPPPPAPVAVAPPRIAPPVVAASSDWRDWPLTQGDWSYAPDAGGSTARFGRAGAAAALTLRCDRATLRVTLARPTEPTAAPNLTIRTSSTVRALALQSDGAGRLTTTLAGADPLLDAMGFSRGRFVVQQPGGATLVLPAWAEILRVVEDCRA